MSKEIKGRTWSTKAITYNDTGYNKELKYIVSGKYDVEIFNQKLIEEC